PGIECSRHSTYDKARRVLPLPYWGRGPGRGAAPWLPKLNLLRMRYEPIDAAFFTANRERLKRLLLPNSLVVLNANDVLPTNADGTLGMCPNSDLFYLTGVEQEESILLLYPDADDEKQ